MQSAIASPSPPDTKRFSRKKPYLNDCHSQLNKTLVAALVRPRSRDELIEIVNKTRQSGKSLMPFGGRHAMGGQQFGTDVVAVDMRGLNRVIDLDYRTGVIDLEAGITWPEILQFLNGSRREHTLEAGPHGWAIAQKQTGADELTIGGSLATNVHGRGLTKAPIIEDVESFTMITVEGRIIECSRSENREWFNLVIGGYGLFGLIYSVRLRLTRRKKLQRVVRTIHANALMNSFDSRIDDGFDYGDFQFQIDDQSSDFLKKGIFSCYQPVQDDTEVPSDNTALKTTDWMNLLHLAHADKSRGFEVYQEHYKQTDGSIYWSDSHQFTTYVNDYHKEIDRRLGSRCRGSEMISELYVPRDRLPQFLEQARTDLRRLGASVIYGTVRLIEQDRESFLAWAREPSACVIFNICVQHSTDGMLKARKTFRALIDRALGLGGSFYLTYHKFARRDQVEAAYPQFSEFLRLKREIDPGGLVQSNWWRHYKTLFSHA